MNDCISITLSFCDSCYHKLNCDHRNYKPNFIIIKDIKKQTYIQFIVKSILSDCGIAICRVFSFTKSWPLGLNQIAYIYSLKKKVAYTLKVTYWTAVMTSSVRSLPWRGSQPASLYVPRPASSDLWKRNGNHFMCIVVFCCTLLILFLLTKLY